MNELLPGQSRLGFMFDGLPDTPHVAVQLQRTDDSLHLRVPWSDDHNPGHERWFSGGVHWGDDPARTHHRYEVPHEIAFVDPAGPVALVGCEESGRTSNRALGVGVGRASVRFAVVGAWEANRYAEINGLRSETEGLPTFLGVRSVTHEHETDDEGRLLAATMRLKAPAKIKIAKSLNLELRPSYSFGPGDRPDETNVRDRTLLQTLVTTSRDRDSHLAVQLRATRSLAHGFLATTELRFTQRHTGRRRTWVLALTGVPVKRSKERLERDRLTRAIRQYPALS